jgi:hypothetical protein
MTSFRAHRRFVAVFGAAAVAVSLAGCTTPPSAAPAADVPAVARTVSPLCMELAEQLEVLNFFPNVIAGVDTSGAQMMADDLKELGATAPAELGAPVAGLSAVMDSALQDPASFDVDAFVDAKIAVEDWGLANC